MYYFVSSHKLMNGFEKKKNPRKLGSVAAVAHALIK